MPTLADLKNFAKYHLFHRVVDHPAPETELGVVSLGYEPEAYVEALRGYADRYEVRTFEEVTYRGERYPLLLVRSGRAARTLLVLAGVHGNEQAGLLAIPEVLDRFDARREALSGVELVVLTPVNPVGAAHFSRYNGDGFDINRDFVRFTTREARAVRRVFDEVAPDFQIALHEGPQDATFMFTNRLVDEGLARALLDAMREGGTTLATENYFGSTLEPPGYSPTGDVGHWVHWVWAKTLEMKPSGSWAEDRGVPEITLESSWRADDRETRVRGHVDLVMATLERLAAEA